MLLRDALEVAILLFIFFLLRFWGAQCPSHSKCIQVTFSSSGTPFYVPQHMLRAEYELKAFFFLTGDWCRYLHQIYSLVFPINFPRFLHCGWSNTFLLTGRVVPFSAELGSQCKVWKQMHTVEKRKKNTFKLSKIKLEMCAGGIGVG